MSRSGQFWVLALALVLPALLCVAHAQQPDAVADPRFDVNRYIIEGNTLLPQAQVERIVAPYQGKQKDFADIQRALEALEKAYRDAGWGVVQVSLPEQDITKGEVRFRVTEARLGKVTVEGNQHFSAENIRRSVPSLREGTTPNSRDTGKNLQVAAENPAKQTTALLRGGDKEGEVEGVIRVTDEKPWKVSGTFDNTGSPQTGNYRLGVGFLHANLFDRDHMLTAQFITSPGHFDDVKIFGLGYRIPLYSWGASIDVVAGYSDVDSGTVQNLFNVSGAGTIGALRYNQHLQRLADYEHKIVYGLDYRAYQNKVVAQGTNIVPDITVHPISAYYAGIYRTGGSEVNFYVYAAQNVGPHGNDADDATFKATRFDAKAAYRLYRYQVQYSRILPKDWQFRGVLNGQYSDDALIPGEQFGVGGADSVRGFLEREIANDKGYRASLELYTPDFAEIMSMPNSRARALVFVDQASLKRNKVQPGELDSQSIASAGFGFRFAWGKMTSARADFAQVLDGIPQGRNKGDQRAHFSLSVVY